jgi:sulfide:quinone oxidoreductase
MAENYKKILIIGGGTAGITTAAHLMRAGAGANQMAIIEPSKVHFYQPLWTLVGGGVFPKERTARTEAPLIPRGVEWINAGAAEIYPDQRYVVTSTGGKVRYDFLIVATGVELDYDGIPGLREALGTDAVSTNYRYDLAPKTWQLIKNFRGGVALFHMPGTPIKCPGAPQKIMYLASDYFRKHKVDAKVMYGSALGGIYGIKEYADVLNPVVARYGIDARYNHKLVAIEPGRREVIFEMTSDPAKPRVTIQYDMLHVVPPQKAPDFVRQSPLADEGGWVKVHQNTMQSVKYPNVFALGDVANSPNAKTGAAACKQAPVVAANLLAVMRGREPETKYDGYVACPIITSYHSLLMCEFDYTKKPTPTIPFINTCKERYDMYLLKAYGLPWMYWNIALRGRTIPFLKAVRPAAVLAREALAQP